MDHIGEPYPYYSILCWNNKEPRNEISLSLGVLLSFVDRLNE